MTDPKWIVDKYIFQDQLPKDAFEKLGIEYSEMEYIPFLEKYDPPYPYDDCVITYGTINAVRNLKKYFGTFLREENLKYHVYSSNYNVPNDWFLNHDSFFVTFRYLRENYNDVYNRIGSNSIFIRPDNGSKSFSGKVIPKIDIELELNCMEQLYNTSNEELILVSTPKIIHEEARFIICGDESIANSRYQIEGVYKIDSNTSPMSIDFVEKVLERHAWVPEEIFTLDVALTESGPKIVELNSFSCAGWYDCDEELVIDKVTNFVYNMWKEQKE